MIKESEDTKNYIAAYDAYDKAIRVYTKLIDQEENKGLIDGYEEIIARYKERQTYINNH